MGRDHGKFSVLMEYQTLHYHATLREKKIHIYDKFVEFVGTQILHDVNVYCSAVDVPAVRPTTGPSSPPRAIITGTLTREPHAFFTTVIQQQVTSPPICGLGFTLTSIKYQSHLYILIQVHTWKVLDFQVIICLERTLWWLGKEKFRKDKRVIWTYLSWIHVLRGRKWRNRVSSWCTAIIRNTYVCSIDLYRITLRADDEK